MATQVALVGEQKKSERTRLAILDSAFEFIWSHPFREMTVNEVMQPIGLSRAAFYQYFTDLHAVIEALLATLRDEILAVASPWLVGTSDPVELLDESLTGLVRICYRRGPILRAVADAAATDERLDLAWKEFLHGFDEAVAGRIALDQERGLIPRFEPMPVAVALNRLDAFTFIDAFGQRPRSRPDPVLAAIRRIWMGALYKAQD